MLRRVKKDVISELTKKKEVTVHCKLSSRQQAFYQAIKNKISLAELFDSNRGHLNEKKIMNLMNIVIQLRKVVYIFNGCSCTLHLSTDDLDYCIIMLNISLVIYVHVTLMLMFSYIFFLGRSVIIQSCLKGMREAPISILERYQILFFPLPLGSWKIYTILDVKILLHTRYFLELFSLYLNRCSILQMHCIKKLSIFTSVVVYLGT